MIKKGTFKLTTLSLALIPVAIGINYIGKFFAAALKLPLWLDVIGTVLSGVLAGPFVGAIVGALTNIIYGITLDPVSAPYAITNAAIGIVSGFLAYVDWFRNIPKVIISGIIISLIATVVSVPITVKMFGGITGAGADFITAYFLATGRGLFESVFAAEFLSDILDKLITVFVVFFILRALPSRYLSKFKGGEVAGD